MSKEDQAHTPPHEEGQCEFCDAMRKKVWLSNEIADALLLTVILPTMEVAARDHEVAIHIQMYSLFAQAAFFLYNEGHAIEQLTAAIPHLIKAQRVAAAMSAMEEPAGHA